MTTDDDPDQTLLSKLPPDKLSPADLREVSEPSEADAAWSHVKIFAEWATEENMALALSVLRERQDEQLADVQVVRDCAERFSKLVDLLPAPQAWWDVDAQQPKAPVPIGDLRDQGPALRWIEPI